MEILRRIGSDAEAAAPAVERILRDDTEDVRYAAVLTIAAIQKDDARLVQSLKSLLSNSSPHVRAAAVQPLGRLGPKAASAVSEVAKLLDDMEDRWHAYSPDAIGTRPVRYDAAMALAKMGRSARSTLPKLQEMTDKDPDSLVRIAAARAVAHLDDDRSHAIEVLIQHVDDPTGGRESIECAACALGELGAKARPAIPSLIRALKNSDTLVRISAARAYAAIDPSNATAVLLPLTQDSDRMVRASVIETIGHLRDESDAVWKVLIASLDDQGETFSYDVRHAAVVALGQLGKKGVSALPRLQKLAEEDESEWVREAAKDAIQKIRQGK
jgi:HEAT repeat protein